MELYEFLNARKRGVYSTRKERMDRVFRRLKLKKRISAKLSAMQKGSLQGNAQAARRRQERAEHGRILTPLHYPVSV